MGEHVSALVLDDRGTGARPGDSKDVSQRKRRRKTADAVKGTAAQKAAVKATSTENKKAKAPGAVALFGLARTAAGGAASAHDSDHTLKMMQRAENIAARNLKRMQRAQALTSLASAR